MSDFASVVEKYGINVAILVVSLFLCWYLIKHFMCFIKEANTERKAITEQYQHYLENHIHENTEAMKNVAQSMKDFQKDNSSEHKIIMEKLK
jgi:sensor domain CHASE-containing protein